MKRFTVKDFIAYNKPCFSCENQINFRIGFLNLETQADASYLRPTVNKDYTRIDLQITYSDSLKLYIFHRTNKIMTNNHPALVKYLARHKLFLRSICDRCYTQVESFFLEFDLEKDIVQATGLATERLIVSDSQNHYQIYTSFLEEKSKIVVDKLDKASPLSPTVLNLPLVPKYKFKDRFHFIEKMKLYLLFS